MNFDSFKMYYVFSNKVNTPIIFKDNGSSYISFEIENCTYSKLFLVSDFYWNKDSDNYNSIEYNLKNQINNGFISHKTLRDIVVKDLNSLIGHYEYLYDVDQSSNKITIKFSISFFYIIYGAGKFGNKLKEYYNKVHLSESDMKDIRYEYERYLENKNHKKILNEQSYEKRKKIKKQKYDAFVNLLKLSSSKNDDDEEYSNFLLIQIINDYFNNNHLETFYYNHDSYDFFILIEENKIYLISHFRYKKNISNPNQIESILSSEMYYSNFFSEYHIPFNARQIINSILNDYYAFNSNNWNVLDDVVQLKIPITMNNIIYSDRYLEKLFREKLLKLNVSEEDYVKYDKLWCIKQEELRREEERIKKEKYEKYAYIREEENENERKKKELLEELGISDTPKNIRSDSLRW